jgi:cytochrome b561
MTELADGTKAPRYSPIQRLLHWGIALAALGVLSGGLLIWFFGFDGVTELLGKEGRDFLYKYHKTFGLIILAAMMVRVAVRVRFGTPSYQPSLPPWQAMTSSLVHKGFYIVLFAMPILGWLATDALDFPVEFFNWTVPQFIDKNKELGDTLFWLHGIVGWMLFGLIVADVGAAMMHAIILRDAVLKRML